MHIKKIFDKKQVVFSFEIFPPKSTSSINTIYNTLEELKDLNPDFISVTFGAGGNIKDNKTIELSSLIKNKYKIEPIAHLTSIGSSKKNIAEHLAALKNHEIENILALRGDLPESNYVQGDFNHADDLISYIKSYNIFNISAACYPEGHLESKNIDEDIKYLQGKVNSGADHLISQLFFDNQLFYNFIEKTEKYKINVPIEAGIMPVINKKQIERIISLCGVTFPKKFIKIVDKYEYNSNALRDAGIAYAVEQIIDLISSGVSGIHLYTMNNPYVAKRITENISNILNSINNKKEECAL